MFASAVILAAGKSTRFPGNKLVHEVSVRGVKAPLIRHTVMRFIESGVFQEVLVVLGFEGGLIKGILNDLNVAFTYNENYESGMSTSVIRGVGSVNPMADVVAIHPGDVPYVGVDTLRGLVRYAADLLSRDDSFIVVPRLASAGRGGHPLVVGKGLMPEVLKIREDELGLKGLLMRRGDRVHYYETDDAGILRDVDTPEDLMR
ncbi:MAG: nucleotidyltransferase family protein [Zestosphaera sp.]